MIAIARVGFQGVVLRSGQLARALAERGLTTLSCGQLASLEINLSSLGQITYRLVVRGRHDFHCMQPSSAQNSIVGPQSSTTENNTCWATGPALTKKTMSPIDDMVAPLKAWGVE